MKFVFAAVSTVLMALQISTTAFAASDSVAVFHKPNKVVVLVNTRQGDLRLEQFVDMLGGQGSLVAATSDGSIRIKCGVGDTSASCTFGFAPSAHVTIMPKSVKAQISLRDLNLPASEDYWTEFESSQGDKFILEIRAGELVLTASKRGA
ncbi:MAG: hypothetical protein JSU04_11725 [Bdellovibrionales bacterium]|nr:hypothetical protein [Bdellovibrionales bacterium]